MFKKAVSVLIKDPMQFLTGTLFTLQYYFAYSIYVRSSILYVIMCMVKKSSVCTVNTVCTVFINVSKKQTPRCTALHMGIN